MDKLLILLAAILPSVLLLWFIWKKDPVPEPFSWLAKAFFWGVGLCIPIATIEVGVQMLLFGQPELQPNSILQAFAIAFLVAAIPEEAGKLYMLNSIVKKNPHFDEHVDGIVYAVCVSLGFATLENIGYVFGSGEDWLQVAISRSLLAVPGHYAFAVAMGYFFSLYYFVERSTKNRVCILAVPVVLHGFYDSLCFSAGVVDPAIGGVCVIVLLIFCYKMHRYAYKRIQEQIARDAAAEVKDTFDRDDIRQERERANNTNSWQSQDNGDLPKDSMANLWH